MSSRDRLSKHASRFAIEREIEELLRTNPKLRKLQEQRRFQDVETKLSEEKPLEEVLQRIFKSSPTLQSLFLLGRRLARPFPHAGESNTGHNGGAKGEGSSKFHGHRHPTFFRIPDVDAGNVLSRGCEEGRRARIKFETDVENEYFDRATDPGTFDLDVIESTREVSLPNFSVTLDDGAANLNMALPPEVQAGDELLLQATVVDTTLGEPFVNLFRLRVGAKQIHKSGPRTQKEEKHGGGTGPKSDRQGIDLPPVISVREGDEHWTKHHFTAETACHVISDPVEGTNRIEHTFYINLDNLSLKTEMKYAKQDVRLLEAKFKYANVLIGLAILHDARKHSERAENSDAKTERDEDTPEDIIRRVASAIAPVVIPVIDQLSGLSEEALEEVSAIGEDA